MRGKVGVPMQTPALGLPDVRINFRHPSGSERVRRVAWAEWQDETGTLQHGPHREYTVTEGRSGQRAVCAAAMMLHGRDKYAIRGGAEVLIDMTGRYSKRTHAAINAMRRRGELRGFTPKPKVAVSRLYIDERPIVGDELRGILDGAIAARDVKAQKSRDRIARLDKALANIEATRAESSEPFWYDAVEDGERVA